MRRYRAILNVFMGLVLMAHGVVASAAAIPKAKPAQPPAAMQMNCHHNATQPATVPVSEQQGVCCQGHCLSMATCSLAHVAIASSVTSTPESIATAAAPVHAETLLLVPRPSLLLRPPIALHG